MILLTTIVLYNDERLSGVIRFSILQKSNFEKMCDYFSKQVRHRKEKLMYARTYDAIYSLAVPEVRISTLVEL